MITLGVRNIYKGFAFEVPRNTIYQLPTPTYRITKNTINGLSDYETICYVFNGDIVTAKQFQAICTIKILLQKKIPQIIFIDSLELENSILDKYYYVNELKALVSPDFVKYQKPLLSYSKDDVYPNICKYAQRLHYERQLHLEGVIYGALTINNKLDISDKFSYRKIMKKAFKSFCNVQIDRPQKLLEDDLKVARIKAGSMGGTKRGKQKSDEALKRIELINKHIHTCTNPKGKIDTSLLSQLTLIPVSSIYRLLSNMNKAPP